MASYLWPGDVGWPIPDQEEDEPLDVADLDAELDLDALSLHAPPPHLFDELSAVERTVLAARFGLGAPERSMKELHAELGMTRRELRDVLASALEKLRAHLAS
jgi:DNA-directed RNA polymerase sigma subunit (sigma70/sigma32)